MPDGLSRASPLTYAPSQPGKWCRCNRCGLVAVCTPDQDFWSKGKGHHLYCWPCFQRQAGIGGPRARLVRAFAAGSGRSR